MASHIVIKGNMVGWLKSWPFTIHTHTHTHTHTVDIGPYTITATSEKYSSISLSDVLFGDVWVCSGQSNMQFTVPQVFNASKEIADAANYPHIRLFTAGTMYIALQLTVILHSSLYLAFTKNQKAEAHSNTHQRF